MVTIPIWLCALLAILACIGAGALIAYIVALCMDAFDE
jgi:hypothetical protein